jgi:hypothetical protein
MDRLSGNHMISYDFGRTWQARLTYRRGVEYAAGISQPVLADGFSAVVEGLVTRRLDVVVSAGYSSGKSALNIESFFDTYAGNARLRYALVPSLAAYVEYLYYFYDSHGSIPLAPGLPLGLERNGIRAGLTMHLSTLRR